MQPRFFCSALILFSIVLAMWKNYRTFASIPSQGGNIYLMLWDKQGMLEQGMAQMPERAKAECYS